MRRRQFITLIGGAAAWPLAARAQQSAMPIIGFLSSRSPSESAGVVAAFRRGLRETGYVEGENSLIAFRWAEGRYDALPGLAADLLALRPAVLFAAGGPPAALAAKAATTSVPIVFSAVNDPVPLGLVASLNRPGANITGMSTLTTELAAKSVQLMKELLPQAAAIAYLLNPTNPTAAAVGSEARAAATALAVDLHVVHASREGDLDPVFTELAQKQASEIIVAGEPFMDSQRERLVALSARYRLPAIYAFQEYVRAGGLMSYGTSITDSYRQAAIYVGRILKGESASDLPVQRPAKFELAINLKTARALGLDIPPTLLARADEVIE